MPRGVYIRTKPASQKQIENCAKMGKLPRTQKQIHSARENAKKMISLPKTQKQLNYYKSLKFINKLKIGENALNWKGEFSVSRGYVLKYCPNHPYAVNNYILYHRLLIEERIGRYLLRKEEVHHENGIRNDNQINNLIAFSSKSAHQRWHRSPESVKSEEIIFDGRKISKT